eukprot:3927762-Pyramimonas_sp.AAC.1
MPIKKLPNLAATVEDWKQRVAKAMQVKDEPETDGDEVTDHEETLPSFANHHGRDYTCKMLCWHAATYPCQEDDGPVLKRPAAAKRPAARGDDDDHSDDKPMMKKPSKFFPLRKPAAAVSAEERLSSPFSLPCQGMNRFIYRRV